jgi:hypothetical protein
MATPTYKGIQRVPVVLAERGHGPVHPCGIAALLGGEYEAPAGGVKLTCAGSDGVVHAESYHAGQAEHKTITDICHFFESRRKVQTQ